VGTISFGIQPKGKSSILKLAMGGERGPTGGEGQSVDRAECHKLGGPPQLSFLRGPEGGDHNGKDGTGILRETTLTSGGETIRGKD